MRKILIAGLLAGALPTPAFAQDDMPAPARDRPAVGGFHVEGLAGYDSARIQTDNDGGVLYGIGAGYDFRVGRAILGIQAEASDSTNQGCLRGLAVPGDSICARASRDLFIGGRAGFMAGRNILLYGTAGYSNARFRVDYDDGAAGTSNFAFSQNLDGVRVGAGAEFGIGSRAFVRTEARYSNYEGGSDRGQGVVAFGLRF